MTKLVRIENADTSNYKVKVEIFDKAREAYTLRDGTVCPATPDTLVKTIRLDHPAAMTGADCCLTSSRYIKVSEVGPDEV